MNFLHALVRIQSPAKSASVLNEKGKRGLDPYIITLAPLTVESAMKPDANIWPDMGKETQTSNRTLIRE